MRVLDIEWLSDEFENLYRTLASADNDILFRNELINILISQQSYTPQIVRRVFIPYLIYFFLQLFFYSYLMKQEAYGDPSSSVKYMVVGVILFLCQILFVGIEVYSARKLSWKRYSTNPWKWIKAVTISVNSFVLLQHAFKPFDYEYNTLVQLASISVICLYLELFYWLRLFDSLAYYVRMVSETIKDISYFIILLVLCIFTFAHAVFVLNSTSKQDDQELYGSAFGFKPADVIVNQYLIGLGEFGTDNYENSPNRAMIWVYFILATFLTQLTFLNMLIAIMGDTYARVTENKEQESLKERTNIYADYIWAITLIKNFNNRKYLYIATPVVDGDDDEGDSDVWEGGIAQIKKSMTRH